MTNSSPSLTDLLHLMHLNLENAAAYLGISAPSLKRLCARLRLRKWPARQVRSLQRLTSMLQQGKTLTPSLHAKLARITEKLSEVHPALPAMFTAPFQSPPAPVQSSVPDAHPVSQPIMPLFFEDPTPPVQLALPPTPTAADVHLKHISQLPFHPL